jgi:hypothetical protein
MVNFKNFKHFWNGVVNEFQNILIPNFDHKYNNNEYIQWSLVNVHWSYFNLKI